MNSTGVFRAGQAGLSRRGFLKSGVIGGAVAATFPALAALGKPVAAPSPKPDIRPSDLDEVTLSELTDGMKSGKYSSHSLVRKYIARIEALDRQGPALRSVIEINPDALSIAAALDQERKEKGPRGPLHGIPVLIKDNIGTADRMATTAGSLALIGSKPSKDSFLVRQLRRSGTVIFGKTNLSEWANIRSPHSTSGWSGRGGLTRNPYALDRNTSGRVRVQPWPWPPISVPWPSGRKRTVPLSAHRRSTALWASSRRWD